MIDGREIKPEMILRNAGYMELAEQIVQNNRRVLVYGAGMIGQIIVPYLIREYGLHEYIDSYVDADTRKTGQSVIVDNYAYEIRTPDYLEEHCDNPIILITNSKFFPIIRFLDAIPSLEEAEGYIVPMMQIHEVAFAKPIVIRRMLEEPVIPKKIHYCWFGGKQMPDFLQKCIESWRQMCPDYEIIEWNEANYDVNRHLYTKQAYENHKFGFVTDLARWDILYENGGIYLDTDVTLLKKLDDCLFQPGFIATEKWGNINSGGGCGFVKNHSMVKKLADYRERFQFVLADGSFNIETNGMYETSVFLEEGFKPDNTLQTVMGVTVYPSYVNHPYDYMSCELQTKESTLSIHHFYGGWMEEDDRKNRQNTQDEYAGIVERIGAAGLY